jgi:predicted nucleic acid-binding protein
MGGVTYLADKSALARMAHAAVAERLAPLISDGQVAIAGMIALELLYSARNREELRAVRAEQTLSLARVPTEEQDFDHAADIMDLLAARGQHRRPIPNLLIAAMAKRAGLTVLHHDADFDLIAAVTGQPTEWVVPRGAV